LANNATLLEFPALAPSMYYFTELEQEIPGGVYLAVAQVLTYVYQIRQHQAGKGKRPDPLKDDLPIPPDLRRDSLRLSGVGGDGIAQLNCKLALIQREDAMALHDLILFFCILIDYRGS
jgi:hypothetical protein